MAEVQYMGETYPLTLRRVPRTRRVIYRWQLGHAGGCEGGCSLASGSEAVADVEAAERAARRYLQRTRPFGQANLHGAADMARKVRILRADYVLLLRTGPGGRYHWTLYHLNGMFRMNSVETVPDLDSAERRARDFMGEL